MNTCISKFLNCSVNDSWVAYKHILQQIVCTHNLWSLKCHCKLHLSSWSNSDVQHEYFSWPVFSCAKMCSDQMTYDPVARSLVTLPCILNLKNWLFTCCLVQYSITFDMGHCDDIISVDHFTSSCFEYCGWSIYSCSVVERYCVYMRNP